MIIFQDPHKGKIERMLDEDIAEKMKDEYPGFVPPTDTTTITIEIEKPSNTDLSSVRSDLNDTDSESEHYDEGNGALLLQICIMCEKS